jgi:hypothetical protein
MENKLYKIVYLDDPTDYEIVRVLEAYPTGMMGALVEVLADSRPIYFDNGGLGADPHKEFFSRPVWDKSATPIEDKDLAMFSASAQVSLAFEEMLKGKV